VLPAKSSETFLLRPVTVPLEDPRRPLTPVAATGSSLTLSAGQLRELVIPHPSGEGSRLYKDTMEYNEDPLSFGEGTVSLKDDLPLSNAEADLYLDNLKP
jgi:hypothetical protein